MALPVVSIVIPCLNMLELTKQTIMGIIKTCDVKFELIVANNGSVDGTKEWLDTIAEGLLKQNPNFIKFTAIHNPYNLGISGGVNVGVLHSIAPFICICANDILVPPNYFSWAIENLKKNPKTGSISPFYIEDERFRGFDNFYNNYDKIPKIDEWTKNWHLSVIQTFTREMWEKVGDWDSHLMNHLMDNDHGQRIYFAGYSPTAWKGLIAFHLYGSLGRAQLRNQTKVAKHDSRFYLKKWGVYPDKPYEAIPECIQKRATQGQYLSKCQLDYRYKIRKIDLKPAGEKLV